MMIWCAWFSVSSSSATPKRFWKAALRKPVVDLDDAVSRQLRHPRRIVQRLGDDLARRAVALELDEHQGTVGRDGQQVNAATVAGDLLPADQHPLARQDRRLADDHVLELLLAGEPGRGQRGGLLADLPDGVLDGHGLYWERVSKTLGSQR